MVVKLHTGLYTCTLFPWGCRPSWTVSKDLVAERNRSTVEFLRSLRLDGKFSSCFSRESSSYVSGRGILKFDILVILYAMKFEIYNLLHQLGNTNVYFKLDIL